MRSPFAFDWLLERAQVAPHEPLLGAAGVGWVTVGELAERWALLMRLLSQHEVGPGARVLIALPNVPATPAVSLAVQALGATAVEVDRQRSPASLSAVARLTGASLAVIYGRDAVAWRNVETVSALIAVHGSAPTGKLRDALGPRYRAWISEAGLPSEAPGVDLQPVRDERRAAQLVFTSGSTSEPRAVITTHENLLSNSESIVASLGLRPGGRGALVLPLFYVYGRSVWLSHLLAGGSVWMDDRFTYPRVVMEEVAAQQCTQFAGVPLTFELLRRGNVLDGLALPALKQVTQAGGAMRVETARWVREAFRPAQLYIMYGQTEATARLTTLPPEWAHKEGSIGRPIPGVELRVVDEQGAEVAQGQSGQLIARGANVTPGYFQAPEATAKIVKGGWLWTGDLARRDSDGAFFITGRMDEMLKLGGHRVAPQEIEEVLAGAPGVQQAVVVGRPDPVDGQHAIGWVVSEPGAPFDEAQVLKHCRAALPAYKVPKRVLKVEALPMTASGKVARDELRKRNPT